MRMRARLGLVTGLLIAAFSSTAFAQVPQSERDALIAFFNSTGGGSWTTSTGWNGAAGTECTWFGVACDNNAAHVTGILLANNNLSGTLPSLAGLPALEQLYVQDNHVGGTIPPLTGLPNLREFYVNGNQLTGTLPSLSGLTNLSVFDADTNQLTGSIPSLSGLTSLFDFDVESNQLTGTIPPLAGLNNLAILAVSNNDFTGALPSLAGLPALQEFLASYNEFSGSIPDLSGFTSLTHFDVSANRLSGTLPALTGLTNLDTFIVSDNQLTGSIPSLSGLSGLVYFSVSRNQLSGSIPSLAGLTGLKIFAASTNALTGSIPPLAGLSSLNEFAVDSNALTGFIPALAGLTALTNFDVSGNQLSGSIPALTGLSSLASFEAAFNQLSGSIPSLSGLSSLTFFDVPDNQLSGSIPSLSGLSALVFFNVGHNQLSGSIPPLAGLNNLQTFYAFENVLTGSIPPLSGLSQLEIVSVTQNKLTGAIPPLAGLTNLTSFDASYNSLTGPIPALSGLAKLQTVYLGLNQLSGPIPDLAGLAALQQFVVDDNQLNGPIPALAGLSNLQAFNAYNNQLTGSIPPLAGLTKLSYFGVAANQLGGTISPLAGLTNLTQFDASFNQLTGSIPPLTGLVNLQQFYLGVNQLSGPIPALNGLGNLQIFAVDDNFLSGPIPALTGLSQLQGFLAASNQLTGPIPALTGLTSLQYFQVGNNRLSGTIPAVPSPDNLTPGLSSLCPNVLAFTPDTNWDEATGLTPWYSTCSTAESTTANDAPTTKDSTHIALSQDGTLKVFQSQQTDLTANAANAGGQDIYSVGADGQTVLESVDASGNKMIGTASRPAVSGDGNVVAFLFTPGAAAQAKDAVTSSMFAGPRGQPKHQVDTGMGGVPPNGTANGAPSLSSANGVNQLVFCSAASNLVPGDANNGRDVFLVDPLNPAIAAQRVSVNSNGSELPGDSCEPKLSSDGNKVVFSLSAPSLYGTAARQIAVKDIAGVGKALLTGQLLPITTSSTGQGATADSSEPTISQDGKTIAFTSQANLDGLGAPTSREVFVSLTPGAGSRFIKRMRTPDANVAGFASEHPQISDDGTAVVMQTDLTGSASTPASLAKAVSGTVANQCGAVAITTNFFAVTPLGGELCSASGSTVNQNPSISGDGVTTGFDSNAPQPSTTSSNANAYSQGVGVNTDVTGNSVANLSGDFSGQWFDPNQSGQGLVIDVTNPDPNNGRLLLLTWFVFSNGQPTWVQGAGVPHAGTGTAANTVVVQMDQVGIFHGASFPLGQAHATANLWGSITLTFTDANTGSMRWTSSYPGFNSGSMQIKHFLAVGLPAQDAPGAQVKACFSGNWFNPAQSGHGFEFEVLPTTPAFLAVDWFAFAPNGTPVWLQGVGQINGNSAQMQLQLIDGTGAQFPPHFDPGAIVQHVWGTATFTFTDSSHASVTWNSTVPGYGSGTQPLQPIITGLMDRRGCQ